MKYIIGLLALLYTLMITGVPLVLAYALNLYVDLPSLLVVFSWVVAGFFSGGYFVVGITSTIVAFFTVDEAFTPNRLARQRRRRRR